MLDSSDDGLSCDLMIGMNVLARRNAGHRGRLRAAALPITQSG
jgi:hypothetical protein